MISSLTPGITSPGHMYRKILEVNATLVPEIPNVNSSNNRGILVACFAILSLMWWQQCTSNITSKRFQVFHCARRRQIFITTKKRNIYHRVQLAAEDRSDNKLHTFGAFSNYSLQAESSIFDHSPLPPVHHASTRQSINQTIHANSFFQPTVLSSFLFQAQVPKQVCILGQIHFLAYYNDTNYYNQKLYVLKER